MRPLTKSRGGEMSKIAMKTTFAVLAMLVSGSINADAQTTCKQRADICAQRSQPDNRPACYDKARMAQCKASGMYDAPSGKSWEASKR
jgi:hypothetical protein